MSAAIFVKTAVLSLLLFFVFCFFCCFSLFFLPLLPFFFFLFPFFSFLRGTVRRCDVTRVGDDRVRSSRLSLSVAHPYVRGAGCSAFDKSVSPSIRAGRLEERELIRWDHFVSGVQPDGLHPFEEKRKNTTAAPRSGGQPVIPAGPNAPPPPCGSVTLPRLPRHLPPSPLPNAYLPYRPHSTLQPTSWLARRALCITRCPRLPKMQRLRFLGLVFARSTEPPVFRRLFWGPLDQSKGVTSKGVFTRRVRTA
jgi:hypothetical protein